MSKQKIVLHSLDELGQHYGLKSIYREIKDKEKLEANRKRAAGKCRICGGQLIHIEGTNVFYCSNEDCKGVKHSEIVDIIENEDGTEQEVRKTERNKFINLSPVGRMNHACDLDNGMIRLRNED